MRRGGGGCAQWPSRSTAWGVGEAWLEGELGVGGRGRDVVMLLSLEVWEDFRDARNMPAEQFRGSGAPHSDFIIFTSPRPASTTAGYNFKTFGRRPTLTTTAVIDFS